jgi:hypothetical protein
LKNIVKKGFGKMKTNPVKRELYVAFSKDVQPHWFRVIKWAIFLGVCAKFYRAKWFPFGLGGLLVAAFTLHFTYRWKTKGWTQAWGGWNDLDAPRRAEKARAKSDMV